MTDAASDHGPSRAGGQRRGPGDRQSLIIEMIERRGWVTVDEISRDLGVSVVTVRHDLVSLADSGRIERTRGGARLVATGGGEPDFASRLRQQTDGKRDMARAAADLLGDAQIISLDASTSCYYLALELNPRAELFVVTNGLRTAEVLLDRPGVSVMVVGGVLRRGAMSMIGEVAEEQISRYHVEIAFFGARAFSPQHGLMDFAPEEARVKRSMASVASRTIGLVDHTKIGRLALLPPVVATLQLTTIVSDQRPAENVVTDLRDHGVSLVIPTRS